MGKGLAAYSKHLAAVLICLASSWLAQPDTLTTVTGPENIATAFSNTKELQIDLSNPEEVELALKKVHTLKYLETITLDGPSDEATLKKIFYRLSSLKNLSRLTLRATEIHSIPDNINGLKYLQAITIEENPELDYNNLFLRLKSLPISELNLNDNNLKAMPASIGELSKLRKIHILGSNQLDYADMVDKLSVLPNLTSLSMVLSYITEVPKNIGKLRSLQVLDVSNNNLTELPPEISALKAINNLSIEGNLLISPAKDLEYLKDNKIDYLALDKEISGEELEKIKKMFPAAQIDFPLNKEEDEGHEAKKTEAPKASRRGELRVRKDTLVLSGSYLLYPGLFQGLIYSFDTLGFNERYLSLQYNNVYQNTGNRNWRTGTVYLRRYRLKHEKPGKRSEIWFRLPHSYDYNVNTNYPELRAFSGMYWVYRGDLSLKKFKRQFISRRKKEWNGRTAFFGLIKMKERVPVYWNDLRIYLEKNNSLFRFQLKSDSGFCEFFAYPRIPDIAIENVYPTYNRRYLLYQKTLQRRADRFKKEQRKNRNRYDINYRKLSDYAWKELQLRMSDDEKAMTREEWLQYFDNIIANERSALDKTPLSGPYISRSLNLRGYTVNPTTSLTPLAGNGARLMNIDFVDAKTGGNLPVSNIMIVDNKGKRIDQITGNLGLAPTLLLLRQFAGFTLLVQMRNGNWGTVSAEEIDKQNIESGKVYKLKTQVFDKNLETIGNLLKSGVKIN